jgi:hypothetical protein
MSMALEELCRLLKIGAGAGENGVAGVSFPRDLWERRSVLEVSLSSGVPEEAAMELPFEQSEQCAAHKAVITGISRALRELWKVEPPAPIPDQLLRLLARLEHAPKTPARNR